MDRTQHEEPTARYGTKVIQKVEKHVAELAARHGARSVLKALAILLKSGDYTAKITLTFTIKEDETEKCEPILLVGETVKVDGKIQEASEPNTRKFLLESDPLPGMEE